MTDPVSGRRNLLQGLVAGASIPLAGTLADDASAQDRPPGPGGGFTPVSALGVANASALDQTRPLTAALNDPGQPAVTLPGGGVIFAFGATHQMYGVVEGAACTLAPPDKQDQPPWRAVLAANVRGANTAQEGRFGVVRNLLVRQANFPGKTTRYGIGYSTGSHNRFYADVISVRNMGIGLEVAGVNYARLSRLSAGGCFIGILIRNSWDGGGSTDFSISESNTISINDPTGSNTGVGILISDQATTSQFGLPMNTISLDRMNFNSSATAHVALISIDPRRNIGPVVTVSNSSCEYIHGNAATNESSHASRPNAVYEYTDPNPAAPFGRTVTKTIRNASFYVETGRLILSNVTINDARPWVVVMLDGPNASVFWDNPGIGGTQDGFAVMATHPDAQAYLSGFAGIGRYQNVAAWPSGGPWSWSNTPGVFSAGGSATSRSVAPPDFRRDLSASINAEAPLLALHNLPGATSQTVPRSEHPINSRQVHRVTFPTGAWSPNGLLSTPPLRGGAAGYAWPEGGSYFAPFTVSLLVRVENTTGNRSIELRWDISSKREGRQLLAPNRWYRLIISAPRNYDSNLTLWSSTYGVGFDLLITRLSLWLPPPGNAPLLNQVLQEGLWMP
jgi:hypothetical protein